jgi:predicted MFS family arabinose efflux permease
MNERYGESTFNELENIARLVVGGIDTEALTTAKGPGNEEAHNEAYFVINKSIQTLFSAIKLEDMRLVVLRGQGEEVFPLFDSAESQSTKAQSTYNKADYFYAEVAELKEYLHFKSPAGFMKDENRVFVCGPVFDHEKNVVAVIAADRDISVVKAQTQAIILKTVLIIAAIAVVFIAVLLLYALLRNAVLRNNTVLQDNICHKQDAQNPKPERPAQKVEKRVRRALIAAGVVFIGLSVFLVLHRAAINLTPWNTVEAVDFPTYASGNKDRIVLIKNSKHSIMVLNHEKELIYRLDAKAGAANSFTSAEVVEIDDDNNLYILDSNFGGAFEENAERVLKYSDKGVFLGEIYAYKYTNIDYIITKGKISGISYFDGSIYIVRLVNAGFYLESVSVNEKNASEVKKMSFYSYPNTFRDLMYFHINGAKKRLAVVTKSGGIKQYDFSGNLVYELAPMEDKLPYTVVTGNSDNLIYTDILSGDLVSLDVPSGNQTVLFTAEVGPYYMLNYIRGMFFAAGDNILLKDNEVQTLNSFSYSPAYARFQALLFSLCVVDILAFLALFAALLLFLSKRSMSETLKMIFLAGICITLGAGPSSFFIIREMGKQYEKSIFADLENVARLVSYQIDTGLLAALDSPVQWDRAEYQDLKASITDRFSKTEFSGEHVYQIIYTVHDGTVYTVYDTESAMEVFLPYESYEDSIRKEVFETGGYVYTSEVTNTGGWMFVLGPIFDKHGNVGAVIETGYDMQSLQQQTRDMIMQTLLIVISAAVAFLLLMIESILIFNAYKQNKADVAENRPLPFRPELLRAMIFFMYMAGNLATALLPMYAARLYRPLFNLPKEFVVTLPFTTDVIFVSLALLVVPLILKKFGIKKLCVMAASFFAIGNGLCFIATNTLHLAVAYALTGFSGGTIILTLTTIIGAQKNVEDVNKGFAHFNASFLAGMNVGVVFGSIFAQFFPYRLVFFFSTLIAVLLLAIIVYSTRSKSMRYLYNIDAQGETPEDQKIERKEDKFALVKFIFNPLVLGTLLLLLLPYQVSSSFTNYFMPIFGTDNGLGESNIGQLILLSGLFAILFGTSLCEYAMKKLPLKTIIIGAIMLDIGGIYLFSLNVSALMLIAVVLVLAVSNIFALTNIQTYYATLYQDKPVSSMKALSIYSAVENLSVMFGPIIFSYILTADIGKGMKLFAAAMFACLAFFVIISSFARKKKAVAAEVSRNVPEAES